jgi:predicted Zn-dependent peptidase
MAKDGLIANYAADFLTTRDPGLFLVWGSVPPDRVMAARTRIAQILGLIAAGDFSDTDLARAKQSLVGSYTLENETVEDQGTSLGFYDAIASYKYAVNYEAMVQATTRDDLERVVKHYFRAVYTVVMAPPGTVVGD